MSMRLEQQFKENGLYRKEIPAGPNSLMRAISDALYFSTQYWEQIQEQILQFAEKLLESELIPVSLSQLKTDVALRKEFSQRPSSAVFDGMNLHLVSMLFKVRVNLYFLVEGRLTYRIWNNNYGRLIELTTQKEHYDPVFAQSFIRNCGFVQGLVYQFIGHESGTKFKNIQMDFEVRYLKGKRANSGPRNKSPQSVQDTADLSTLRSPPPGLQLRTDSPKKPLILEESRRMTGRLKFFDEVKQYGFIVLDIDQSDIFVHVDDLQKAGITKEYLRSLGSIFRTSSQVNHYNKNKAPYLEFTTMVYVGKYNKSRKAVDLKIIDQ